MSAKSIVTDEYPQAVSIKNDDTTNVLKMWSIMVGTKCIGTGRTENVAWTSAKSYVKKRVMHRVFEKI